MKCLHLWQVKVTPCLYEMARMDISGRQSLMFFSQFINIQVKSIWASSFAGRLFKFSMFSHFNWCSAQVHLFFNTLKSKKIWLRVSWCQEEIKLWSNCGILQRGSPETFLYKSISILLRYNTLHLSNWSSEVVTIIAEYQTEVIAAAERGFDGKDIPGEGSLSGSVITILSFHFRQRVELLRSSSLFLNCDHHYR